MGGKKKIIISFLQTHPLGVLSTVHMRGHPELASVYLAVDEDLGLYFVTKTKTRKLKNILTNEHVAFITFDEPSLTTVEIIGKARLVEDTLECAHVFDAFHALFASRGKDLWLPPIAQIKAGTYVACRIIPERICHRNFNTTKGRLKSAEEIILKPRQRAG